MWCLWLSLCDDMKDQMWFSSSVHVVRGVVGGGGWTNTRKLIDHLFEMRLRVYSSIFRSTVSINEGKMVVKLQFTHFFIHQYTPVHKTMYCIQTDVLLLLLQYCTLLSFIVFLSGFDSFSQNVLNLVQTSRFRGRSPVLSCATKDLWLLVKSAVTSDSGP